MLRIHKGPVNTSVCMKYYKCESSSSVNNNNNNNNTLLKVQYPRSSVWRQQGLSIYLTLTVLVTTIDAQWEGMGDVGSARYEPALHPPCPTIRALTYSN